MFTDTCMSPVVRRLAPSQAEDEPMSPDRGGYGCTDVPMSPVGPGPAAGGRRVTDPWDSELIAELLSRLSPPLGSHPHCISWQCNVPSFTPRTTITMGKGGLGSRFTSLIQDLNSLDFYEMLSLQVREGWVVQSLPVRSV